MSDCPEFCMMCTGEACDLCGAGCWSNREDCQHDVIDRHQPPGQPFIGEEPSAAELYDIYEATR